MAGPATNRPSLVLSFWRAGTGRAGPTSGEQSPGGSDTPGSGRPSPSAGAPESSGLSASPSASCSGSAFTRLDFATGRESGTCTWMEITQERSRANGQEMGESSHGA